MSANSRYNSIVSIHVIESETSMVSLTSAILRAAAAGNDLEIFALV